MLHDHHDARPWWEWPAGLAARDAQALTQRARRTPTRVLEACWTQWIAQRQWEQARRDLEGIALVGDLPFMVSADSADVWAHQQLFSREATVGTPPDAFSETGQDWGLPVYRWDAMRADDFGWLRARGRRMAAMFDAFRIDHLVGFYRTYWRPANGDDAVLRACATKHEQRRLGEEVIEAFASAGAALIAEDLGTIPDFVRASLQALRLPGYKVLRWERDWHVEGQPFHDPATYAAASLATTGTHDTDMLADWWDTATDEERTALLALPGLRAGGFSPDQPFDDALRDALIDLLMQSGSDLVIFPLQDVFGWRDRINVPATVGAENWSWASAIPVDRLMDDPMPAHAPRRCARWSSEAERTGLALNAERSERRVHEGPRPREHPVPDHGQELGPVRAPELDGAVAWLNTPAPITLAQLRGKIVLLDFWTYGCINCQHVLPDLQRLQAKFADVLVVIGIHAAKFDNERSTENIRRTLQRLGIRHPVANDARVRDLAGLHGAGMADAGADRPARLRRRHRDRRGARRAARGGDRGGGGRLRDEGTLDRTRVR